MLKKTALATVAVLMSTLSVSAMAADHGVDNTSTQLQAIQKKIDHLKSEVAQAQGRNQVTTNAGLSQTLRASERGYIGLDDTSDVMFERDFPATSFALALLKNKPKYKNILTLGGYVEQDIQYWHSSLGNQDGNGTNAYLTTFQLDAMANINPWVTSFIGLKVNNFAPTQTPTLNLVKAFITIGNLSKSPVYFSIGQDYVPFGLFTGNGPWASTITKTYFRSDELPEMTLGYDYKGFNSTLTVTNDKTKAELANVVYSLAYDKTYQGIKFHVGGGYINNLYALTTLYNQPVVGASGDPLKTNRNPGWDINGKVAMGPFSLAGEYIASMKTPSFENGKMQSWYIAGGYAPVVAGKPLTIGLTYSAAIHFNGVQTGLSAPLYASGDVKTTTPNGLQSQWIASVSRNFLPHLTTGLEFQRSRSFAGKAGYSITIDNSYYF